MDQVARNFQNFPQFIVIHRVKGFGTVNKAEIDVFMVLSCAILFQKRILSDRSGETLSA